MIIGQCPSVEDGRAGPERDSWREDSSVNVDRMIYHIGRRRSEVRVSHGGSGASRIIEQLP
eukprot:3215230-Alexandrium_andersonii.AAC.1